MKNTALSIELSSFALEHSGVNTPNDLMSRVRAFLNEKIEQMGRFIRCDEVEFRPLGTDLKLAAYELRYEKRVLQFQLAFFRPRGTWEVQGFRFV